MDFPKITIITVCLNAENKIQNTIESVLGQCYPNMEYIIIDGKSMDETVSIIKRYKDKIVCISETDQGIYDAMNKGIVRSTGDYILFLGAGDILCNDILKKIKNVFSFGNYQFIYGNVYMKNIKKIYNGKYNKYKISRGNICHQSIFYKRSIFETVGQYESKYNILADWFLNIKCFSDPTIKKFFVDEIISEYEGDGISETIIDEHFMKDFRKNIIQYLGINAFVYYRIIKICSNMLSYIGLKEFTKKFLRMNS